MIFHVTETVSATLAAIAGADATVAGPADGRRALVVGIISQLELALRHIRCSRSEQLVRSGVSMTHLHVIWQLEDHGGSLTMGRLADLLGVSMSNVTGLVDRMEERGLVERLRPSDDRRVVHVRPTTAGLESARAFELIKTETIERVLDRLDATQLTRLLRAIDDVRGALGAEFAPGDTPDDCPPALPASPTTAN
jgi:DNA-binding MarR family transcriptional regulator